MKDLIIIGAGDFSRETMWVAERMNLEYPQWNLLGFADDNKAGETVDGYPVLGDTDWLLAYDKKLYVTNGIGSGPTRKKIWDKLSVNGNLELATIIDPSVIVGKDCVIGEGSIICAGSVMAIGSRISRNCIMNFHCSLGHDTILEDFCTVHPGCNISGRVLVRQCSEIGTGTKIIQGKTVGEFVIVGAGAVVVKDLEAPGTYVGAPARMLVKTNKGWKCLIRKNQNFSPVSLAQRAA